MDRKDKLRLGLLLLALWSSATMGFFLYGATSTTDLGLRKPADNELDWGSNFRADMDTLDAAICDKRSGKTCTISGTWTFSTSPVLPGGFSLPSPVDLPLDTRFGAAGSTVSTKGVLVISTGTSASTTGVPSIFISTSGYIGIGTASPRATLSILGNDFRLEGSDASPNMGYLRFGDNTGWKFHIGRSREASGVGFNTGTLGSLVTFNDNGNVGIGTTSPGTYRLDINGGLRARGLADTGLALVTTTDPFVGIGTDTPNGFLEIFNNSVSDSSRMFEISTGSLSSQTLFATKGDGKVGIKKDVPTQMLDVEGSGLFSSALTASSVTATGTGNSVYSLDASSGIRTTAGDVDAKGLFRRDGTPGLDSTTCTGSQSLTGINVRGGIVTSGTCSASGAGDAVLNATQTWTGANTWNSTSTFPSGSTVAIDAGATTQGIWHVIFTTYPKAGSTGFTIPDLLPGYLYRVTGTVVRGADVFLPRIQFNGDTGNNYRRQAREFLSNGTSANSQGNLVDNFIQAGATNCDWACTFHFFFSSEPDDSTHVVVNGTISGQTNGPNSFSSYFGGMYDGASALSSIKIFPSANDWKGLVILERLDSPGGRF